MRMTDYRYYEIITGMDGGTETRELLTASEASKRVNELRMNGTPYLCNFRYVFPESLEKDDELKIEIIETYFESSTECLEPKDIIDAFLGIDPKDYLSQSDYAVWESLPKQIEIYRGCDIHEMDETGEPLGISWTTDYKVAEFFAYRFKNPDGCIVKMTVPKEAVICFTNRRKEFEIIINPFCDMSDYEIISQGQHKGYDASVFHEYINNKVA